METVKKLLKWDFYDFLKLKTELETHLKGHGYVFGQKLFLRLYCLQCFSQVFIIGNQIVELKASWLA